MDDHSNRPAASQDPAARPGSAKASPPESEKVRRLKAMANHGFFAMALFIALSIGAVNDFEILPSFPESFRAMLGHPPSANMISAALLLYSFAAIVLILSRMTTNTAKFGVFANVGYLAGFYFFYHFAGSLAENFWAVFAAGVTVLGLETYSMRTYCNEEIKKEREGTGAAEGDDADFS